MTAIAKKNLDHWSRVPQMIEAHNNEGPITRVPQEQKYTLHARIIADFSKYLSQVDWQDPLYCKLLTDKKDRANYNYSETMKSHGYSLDNTEMQQKIMKNDDDPAQNFFRRCAAATRLDNVEVMICMQPTGNMTPLHQDFFCAYRERWNLDISDDERYNRIKRFWMPLEDWKNGHFYQSNKTVFWNWKAGEMFAGPGDTPHLAATAGTEPRYFAQITGCLPESGDYIGKNGYEELSIT